MTAKSQKRALKNYRKRLNDPGMARFEVLGLDADRELIRSLARRLAKQDEGAARIRASIGRSIRGEQPKKGGFWLPCGVRPWSEPSWGSRAHLSPAGMSICDTISA